MDSLTHTIQTHLIRVFDHFNASVKSYNYPVMLDLASSLFVLTELIDEITKITGKVFTTSRPHILVRKLFKRSDHIYIHFANPITTYAKGLKGEMRETVFWPAYLGKNCEIRLNFRQKEENPEEFKLKMFFIRDNKFNDVELDTFNKYSTQIQIKDKSFTAFMTEPFIYFKLKDNKYNSISRKDLIVTVANEHNARHAKKEEDFKKTKYTDPVRTLMDFKLAGLPIPFFGLLHIANDIVSKIVEVKKKTD